MYAAGLPFARVGAAAEPDRLTVPQYEAEVPSTPCRAEVLFLVRGLYTAASGALVAQAQVDVIANNLANVNTAGFKSVLLQVQSAPELGVYRMQTVPAPGKPTGAPSSAFVGALGTGAMIMDTPNSFAQGGLKRTGNDLDVAIEGNAFFAVNTPNGIRYTRDGEFTRDANSVLVTMDGNQVLGQNGPITLQQGPVQIGRDGSIVQNHQVIDTLRLTQFGNLTALRPEGDVNYVDTGAAGAARSTTSVVQQGFLESSNASVVRSMVDLITAQRWFEANQKVIMAQDNANAYAIQKVGITPGA